MGVWHEIFSLKFFMSQFPKPPEYPIRTVSNFFPKIRGDIHEWMFISDVNDIDDKREKFSGIVFSYFVFSYFVLSWVHFTLIDWIFANFLFKGVGKLIFEMDPIEYSGSPRGTLINENNLKVENIE